MKLKNDFITHESNGEHIMVGVGEFNGLVKSNKTAAEIIELLKTNITEEEITAKMLEKYDAPKDVIYEDVKNILVQLRKIGAIDE